MKTKTWVVTCIVISGTISPLCAANHSLSGADQIAPQRSHGRTSTGEEYILDEVKVTLRDGFIRSLRHSTTPGRGLDAEPIRKLHPGIDSVLARHTAAACLLEGRPFPPHLRTRPGEAVPLSSRMLTLRLKPGSNAEKVVQELRQRPEVQSASLNVLHRLAFMPNDPKFPSQWAPPVIGLTNAWNVAPRGNISVASVDTGVDLEHPEFAGRIIYNRGFGDFANGDAPADGRDGAGHGTHVAGIVAAAVDNAIGVAGFGNQIRLLAMGCATWSDGEHTYKLTNVDDAINEAIAQGARVINCSFENNSDLPASVNEAIDAAFDANVLIVAAAGNDGQDISGVFWGQSAVPFIISSVAQGDVLAVASNYGSRIDLAAPGQDIYSTLPTGFGETLEYGSDSGTSMAAPMVSGAAALILSMNPTLLEDHAAKDLLRRMATDLPPPGHDSHFGDGRLFLSEPVLRAVRNADAFVSRYDGGSTGGYDTPYTSLPDALAHVGDGARLVLNGGDVYAPVYNYPPISIAKPCTLDAIPDRPVVIGIP